MREAREEMLQSLNESNLEKMRKASKGAAQTLKMKDGSVVMDSFTASAIMQIYDKINDKNKKTMENLLKDGKKADIVKLMKFAMSKVNAEYVPEDFEEEVELDEAKYDLYHKDFSTAMQHAYKMAKKMYGITVDPKEIDDKVASGPKKPSEGKTNSYRLKGDKGAIQVQVYNKGGSKPFELNMYKEEVELDESKKALKAKSEKSGVSVGILSKVYDRGMAAWKTGHRPGTTPQQWALARVNSFLTGGGARKADNDLWQQAKKQKKEEVELAEDGHTDIPSATRQCKTIMEDANQILAKLMTMNPEASLPTWWSNKLAVSSNSLNKMRDYLLVSSEMKEELEEALDKEDEPTIKRIVGKLKKASQAHAGQAKDLQKAMDEQPEHEITVGNYTTKFFYMCGSAQKVMSKNADVEGAEELTRMQDDFYKLEKQVMDAGEATDEQKEKARNMYNQIMKKAGEIGLADDIDDYMKMHIDSIEKGDPKLGFGRTDLKEARHKDIDPADIDTSATDDDIKAADKNIMMQLRKSVSLRGQFPVEFLDKKKVKIPQKIAQAVIKKYNSLRKPMDKEKFQAKIAKSHKDLLMALKEGFASDAQRRAAFARGYKAKGKKDKKESTLERMNKKIQENKNG